MLRQLTRFFLVAGLLALLTACATTPDTPVTLSVSNLARGAYSNLEIERFQIIHDAATLERLWQQAQISKPVPTIDFTQNSVVLVALGERPTGGYRVDVSQAVKARQRIEITVTIRKPGDQCVVTQVVTMPYHFVAVPIPRDISLPIDFTVEHNIIQCGG
ncbi:MAG TPA: protease complex subunit PrcB family protein [Gammaproteobacteria bacterium]|nr:protease complex subunit PrcB family protein [Gammaproteobacteria bacterium]